MFLLLLVLVSAAFSKENKNTLRSNPEYIVQIREDWLEVIKLEAPRFGLTYKRKLVSNVHLFGEIVSPLGHRESEEALDVNIRDFTEFFGDTIIEIEHRQYATVKYHTWRNKTMLEPRAESGRWILQRRAHALSKACWPYYGMGVQDAWSLGFTGLDIRVAVVDVGVEMNHPDLERNIDTETSYSFVDDDHTNINPQRFLSYWETEEITSHGTMAAGLIAGEFGNDRCSAGVAFDAKLVALKVFKLQEDPAWWLTRGFTFSLDHVAAALGYKRNEIDVYSCSFNLNNMFEAASLDMRTTLREGVEQGRNGKGNIFVFSAGDNTGPVYDCNMDSLANSMYTITISSVGTNGSKPSYAIPCACTLASTYGEFKTYAGSNKLESTGHGGTCSDFIGTSASAALASGIIAQTLQANTELTWRDMQYILILTSSFEQLQSADGIKMNARGLQYDAFFGFGLVNATAMVLLAQQWTTVPRYIQHTLHDTIQRYSSVNTTAISLRYAGCTREEDCVRFLEHVIVHIRYTTSKEQLLDIMLCSPANSCSNILNWNVHGTKKHKRRLKRKIKRTWTFTSVQFWGENPKGIWWLLFQDFQLRNSDVKNKKHFSLHSATITLSGTAINPCPDSYDSGIHVLHNDSDMDFPNGIRRILKYTSVSETVDYVEETTKDPINDRAVGLEIILFFCTIILIMCPLLCTRLRTSNFVHSLDQ